ncbi:MAG: flagellar M-ring protein FliF C-terminal domain-containing protein [Pirellulales bacterium]
MNSLNKLFAQVRELFLSMTPAARITAGLLLAVVVVSLAFLFQQGMAGPDEYLFGGEPFSAGQIAQVEAALATVGNDFRIEGNRIRVPRSKKDVYIAAVADAGALPRNIDSIMSDALDGGSFLESREAKRSRMQAASESRLSYIISLMPWVDQAFVTVAIEESRGLKSERPASATVNVLPLPGELLDGRRLRNLQKLVAGTHPSLATEKVVVTNLGDDSDAISGSAPEDYDDEYYQLRMAFENNKREDISKVLSYIPGVRVQVSANLDDTIEETIRDVKPAQPGVMVRSTSDTEKTTQATTDGGGQPGLEAQGPNRRGPDQSVAAKNQSETTRNNTQEENVVGFTESELRRTGYKEKEVFASVAVPRDYIVNVWKQLNPPTQGQPPKEPDENELKIVQSNEVSKIENLVKPLLPRLTLGEDEYKQVHVEVVNSVTRDPLPEPSFSSHAMAWTGQNWGTVSMLGLAAFSLLMLRSIVRSSPNGESSSAVAGPTLRLEPSDAPETESSDASVEPPRQRLRLRKSHSLKEDLAEIVREDPEAAAMILRNWISNVG